jgi:hypothetical protein
MMLLLHLRTLDRQLLYQRADRFRSAHRKTVMDKRGPFQRTPRTAVALRAQRHFQTIALLEQLDRAERYAGTEEFAAAARIAARALSNARGASR